MGWSDAAGDVVVLLCTVPDEQVGAKLAQTLVGERLAACVNMVPGLRSIYRWKDEVCDDPELLLVIKTTDERVRSLAQRVESLHPYDTPELIALPLQGGLEAYVGWVRDETA